MEQPANSYILNEDESTGIAIYYGENLAEAYAALKKDEAMIENNEVWLQIKAELLPYRALVQWDHVPPGTTVQVWRFTCQRMLSGDPEN